MAHRGEAAASSSDPENTSSILDHYHRGHGGQENHELDVVVSEGCSVKPGSFSGDQISILQSATDFDIHGGSFSTIAGDSYIANRDIHVTIHNHPHSLVASETREILTEHDQINEASYILITLQSSVLNFRVKEQRLPLPIQRSCDIYRRHLASKGRGIPLWIPEPNKNLPLQYQRQGIAIGDVGIITASGGFSFLFNICLSHDHPINPPTLPVNFKPIQIAPVNVDRHSEFKNNSYLASASTVRSQNDGDTSGLIFESSASDGAILTMPAGSRSEDLSSVGRFRKYVAANMVNWYKYAYHDREYDVRNGDLRLVIGYDTTSSWGMATFSNSAARQEFFQLRFGLMEGRRYGWEYSGTAEVRAGPDFDEITQLRNNEPSQQDVKYENQCLFIRTINATLSDEVWGNMGFDYDEVNIYADSDAFNGPWTSVFPENGSKLAGSSPGTSNPPGFPQVNKVAPKNTNLGINNNILTVHGTKSVYSYSTFLADHPSNVINAMLLKNSSEEVTMAITQDQNWMSVLNEQDAVLPSSKDILERIKASFDIYEEEGVVYLTKIQDKKYLNDPTIFATMPREYVKNHSDIDLIPQTLTTLTTSARPILLGGHQGSSSNALTLEPVPSFYTGVSILKSAYRNIERLKIYKEKCREISARCFDLMKALVDGSQGVESSVVDIADEVEGIVSRFDRTVAEWASWSRLKSILRQREIKDGISQLHRDMEVALSKFQLQIHMETTRNATHSLAIQKHEQSEIRKVLRTIVKSSEDMKALLSMQSSSNSNPVEEMMERLQTELMDPMLQPNETEDYKAGLWFLHQKTSKLPPLTDLTGQIKWASPELSAHDQASAIFKGLWLDRETVSLRRLKPLGYGSRLQHSLDQEVSFWRTLDHPNIVPVYGVVYVEENVYIVSPWMDNGSAIAYLKKSPQTNRLDILSEVAYGLEYLHDNGVVHGDIRGENVFISITGNARVAQFGQSKYLAHLDENAMVESHSKTRWPAPEKLRDTDAASTHSDVWSYGMLCLEILSDEPPYNDIPNDAAVVRELNGGNHPSRPTPETAHGLSDGMWTLLRKCWRQTPESRPSMSEVRTQLLELQEAQQATPDIKPLFSILKDRQKGQELHSTTSITSQNSSTSYMGISSEKLPSSSLDPESTLGATNAASLPSSAVSKRPLPIENSLLRVSNHSSDSIAEPIREALLDSRILLDIVDGIVRRGTLEGLVNHLINTCNCNTQKDIEFRYLLLFACPDFTTPENLFNVMSRRFYGVESDADVSAEDKITLQYNIFTIIIYWLSEQDLRVEQPLRSRIKAFCEDSARIKASATMYNKAMDILQLVEQKGQVDEFSRVNLLAPLRKQNTQSRITPIELAIALTLLEGDKYRVLTPVDYLGHLRRHPGTNNVEGVYTINNMIILWVKDSILRHDGSGERASMLRFFVDTATECRKLRNFSSLIAIATALHSSPIEKLRLTKLGMGVQTQNKLEALKDILDVTANHRAYREALEEGTGSSGKAPCIPWLPIHLKDLHAVLQRYPIVVQVDHRPLINFERYVKFMDRVKEAVQYMPPDMERYRQQGFVEHLEKELSKTKLANLTDDDLVTRSKMLEAQEMMERRNRKSQLRHLGFLKKM